VFAGVLHHQRQQVLGLLEVVDAHHVGAIYLRRQLRLQAEALAAVVVLGAPHPGGIAAQHLDGAGRIQLHVRGEINLGEGPLAQQPLDAVFVE